MTILLLLLILHGVFLVGVLSVYGRRHDRANLVLAALVGVASLLLLETYLGKSGITQRWGHLRGVLRPLWFLVGPLCLLYVHRFLGRPAERRDILLTVLPTAAVTLWMLPYLLQPAAAKVGRWEHPGGSAAAVGLYLAFSLLTAWCALRSHRAIREAQRLPERASLLEAPWRSAWVRWLMAGLAAYAVLDFASAAVFLSRGYYPGSVGLASLLILTSLLYGTGMLVVLPDGLLARAPWPGKRYARSQIPASWADKRLERLKRLMVEERLWFDYNLSLQELAGRLGVSRHVLSQLLNENLETTFHDYINAFRVEEAKALLLDLGSRRSVLDVGLESGFGANATFYRAFKKHTGMTPTEFLASAASEKVEPIAGHRRPDRSTSS